MVVQRSPFSNQGDNSGVNLYGGKPSSNVSKGLGIVGNPNVATPKIQQVGKGKTSVNEEQAKLDRAYSTALAKIASSAKMSESEKKKQRRMLDDVYRSGGNPKSKAVFGGVGTSIVKSITDIPAQSIKSVLETTAGIGRTIQSGWAELDDAGVVPLSPVGNPVFLLRKAAPVFGLKQKEEANKKASWSEFVKQAKDKDFKPVNTGNKWYDGVSDFGLDVGTDLTTYMGVGPLNYVGKAGRAELAVKFGTTEMMSKYPQLAGKLDNIVRYGVSAIPREVRDAEGLKFGLRFAGQIVPKTEFLARTVSGKGGIATTVRAGLGDVIEKSGLKGTRALVTPASRKGFVMKSIGRKAGLSDQQVIEEIANYSAAKYGRSYKSYSYKQNLNGIKETVDAVRKAPAGVSARVVKLVENPSLFASEPDAQVRQWAQEMMSWQDQLRNQVNDVYRKFNLDYNANANDIGFVDDYIHHRITPEALNWIYGKDTAVKASRFFKDGDMTQAELGASSGAAMYRRVRKPYVDENGVLRKGSFMGEEVNVGDIEEINSIFKRVTGLDVKFFEDDIAAIADSYAYSMAAARGREATVRRLFDYGPNVVRVVDRKLVPDKELATAVNKSHSGLLKLRKDLVSKVNRGRADAGRKAEDAVRFASRLLDSKDEEYARIGGNIMGIRAQIAKIETDIAQAYNVAASKGAEQRGLFLEVHKTMIEELQVLKNAVESGRLNEFVAYDTLKSVYMDIFPEAKRVPKSASKLLDAINRHNGVKDSFELKELNKRLAALQKQLKEAPPVDAEDLNDLLDIEQRLVRQIDGFEVLSEVKLDADYADDGLLFGVMDDLVERPFDPNLDPAARVISTRPLVRGGAELGPDEMAAARNAALSDPSSVAVHAIPNDEILDMRLPETFYDFWDPQEGVGEAVAFALRQAGLDEDDIFRTVWNDLIDGEAFDPMFEQVYPELADLMEYVAIQHTRKFDTAVVDDNVNVAIFDTMQEIFADVAGAASLENSDMVAQQMMDDFVRAMAEEGMGNTGKPVLFPSRVIYGADNEMADGAYSLVLPDRYKYSKRYGKENIDDVMIDGEASPVFLTAGDDFVRSITDADYHTAAIDAAQLMDELSESAAALKTQLESNTIIKDEVKKTAGAIGGIKSQGSRRMRVAEKALREYQESGLVEVTKGGKRVKVTRDEAIEIIAKSESKQTAAVMRLEERIAKATESEVAPLLKRKAKQEERLASLFNARKAIERWDDAVGDALREDINLLKTAIATDSPTGWAGTQSRVWSDNVTNRMNNVPKLGDTAVARAWERVATQLGADEAQLAMLEMTAIPESILEQAAVLQGLKGGQVVDDVIDGWTKLKGLNVQIPPEMENIIMPNLEKLKNAANWNPFVKAYKKYNTAFKIYATMSPGFVVRNAMSATFMNHVAGVTSENMVDGVKAVIAYRRLGPDGWLGPKGLNITDSAVRDVYETAMRSTLATGRGISQEFASPVVNGGWSDKIVNNWATQKLANANDFTEMIVRFPMGLDSIRRGQSLDEAVYRISKYHFDYSDLSKFDEGIKNFIPFWIFASRNLPLQWTEQLLRPSAYARWENIKERNPVAEEVVMPTWLQNTGPLGLTGNWVLNPDLPMNRLAETSEAFVDYEKLLGMANPLAKVPFEIFGNRKAGTGVPFSDKWEDSKGASKALAMLADKLGFEGIGRVNPETGGYQLNPKVDYLAGNIAPPIGTAQRLTGGAVGGKPSYEERQLSSILTWLGLPVRNVGPDQQRGAVIGKQFDIADLIKELAKQGKVERNR